MTTPAQQRLNMVESQIRPSDVTDRRILRAMSEVERECFVPAEFASLAYMDEAAPLAPQAAPGTQVRTLMAPRSFAKLIQLAAIEPTDAVLIVGAGRGYSAAIAAKLAASVDALECDFTLATAAKSLLAGNPAISVSEGALPAGPAGDKSYDVIIIEGAVPARPDALIARLKHGGRLVAIHAPSGVGTATRWTKTGAAIAATPAFEATAPVLPGFEREQAFVL